MNPKFGAIKEAKTKSTTKPVLEVTTVMRRDQTKNYSKISKASPTDKKSPQTEPSPPNEIIKRLVSKHVKRQTARESSLQWAKIVLEGG